MKCMVLLFQECRQQSAADQEALKNEIEETKGQIETIEKDIEEINSAAAKLEKEKHKVVGH